MTRENLLPKHRVEAWRVRRCMNAWAMSLLTLSLLACGLVIGSFMIRARPMTLPIELTEQIESDRSELALVQEQTRSLQLVEAARQRTRMLPRWEHVIQVAARETSGHAQLRAVRTERASGVPQQWTLSIVGVSPSRQAPGLIAARLEATGLFSQVRHGLAPSQAGQGEVEFYIDCTISPGVSQ